MDKLQQLLNFKNSNGEVLTVFNGKLTLSQLVMIITVILVIAFVVKLLKGVVRTVCIVVALCILAIHFGLTSPTQLKDVSTQLATNGISAYH
jgi:uncharacterized membrane protein